MNGRLLLFWRFPPVLRKRASKRLPDMNRLLQFLFVLLASSGIYACTESSKLQEVESPVAVSEFRNFPSTTVSVDSPINLQVLFQTANGCGRFSRVDTATVGKEFTLQYFVKYPIDDADVVCSDISKPLVFTIPFRPREAGTYRFRIWKDVNAYEEKTIVVE